ncbi:MAG: CRISPR-associated protein Cas5 [Chitinophagales bacterium]|nr:CRISPR-associated protein Cas5 [Chitinophagales bacterium]
MNYLAVEIRTVTATFRNPEFQNFHKTLHLPPPTTLVGLAGAALGKSPKAAQEWFERDDWQLGISGISEGYAKDLWKYNNKWDKENGWESSVLLREILFDNRFFAIFGSPTESKILTLKEAFWEPKYALTLGSSDSLVKVVSAEIVGKPATSRELSNCLTPGNVLSNVLENVFNWDDFSIYSTSEPIAYDLPTRFKYESDYGVRRVMRRKTFSFIGNPMQLNFEVPGIWLKNQFIPIFSLHGDDRSTIEEGT